MRGSPCSYRIPGCWVKHIRHVFPESLVQTIAMSATCDLASLRVGLLLWKMEMKYILFWHMKGFSDQWWLRPLNLVHPNKASARKIVHPYKSLSHSCLCRLFWVTTRTVLALLFQSLNYLSLFHDKKKNRERILARRCLLKHEKVHVFSLNLMVITSQYLVLITIFKTMCNF